MKKVLSLMLSGVLVAGLSGAAWGSFIETFDENSAGWQTSKVRNNGSTRLGDVDYISSGGQEGGYISAGVNYSVWRLYSFQPSDISNFGNLSGQALTVATKSWGEINGPGNNPTARFFIGNNSGGSNYFVSNDVVSWDVMDDTDWQSHVVELLESNFIRWPNSSGQAKSFAEVIANPQDIGIFFTDGSDMFRSNNRLGLESYEGATIGMDNFGVLDMGQAIPEPVTIVLLGLGTVPFIRGGKKGACG